MKQVCEAVLACTFCRREELISKMGERSKKRRDHKFNEACVLSLQNGLTSGTSLPLAWIYWHVEVSQLVHKLCYSHLNNNSYVFVFIHQTLISLQTHKGCHPKSLSVSGHPTSCIVLISYTLWL